MLRSLYSGVSGLLNHQVRMDVIGNNVSNVNSTGFKKGRVNFQDLISQTLQGAARPTAELGGVNPKQVGLGVQVAAIDTLHTQGALRTTGVKSDLSIQGEGFFILREGVEQFYTRSGAFSLDEEGVLVNPANGLRVQGWNAELLNGEALLNTSSTLQDIVIPVGGKDPASETTQVFLSSNLDRNTPIIPAIGATATDIQDGTWTVEYDIFDAFGNNSTLRIEFTRAVDAAGAPVPNQWQGITTINPVDPEDPTAIPTVQTLDVGGVGSVDGQTFLVDFSNDGTLLQVSNVEGGLLAPGVGGELTFDLTFDVPGADIDPATGAPQTQTIAIDIGQVGAFVDSITQYAASSTTRVFSQNGYGLGYLEDYRIDQRGVVTGVYSNGANREIAQVALSIFTNPGGLESISNTNFAESINSGTPNIGVSNDGGRGTIIAGTLEMSNVDLAEEFTDMIVTQRGFQANSRTITTSDQLLQELLTLKR